MTVDVENNTKNKLPVRPSRLDHKLAMDVGGDIIRLYTCKIRENNR